MVPKILLNPLRQYMSNDGSPGYIMAFDYDKTIAIVSRHEKKIKELEDQLVTATNLLNRCGVLVDAVHGLNTQDT